MVPEVTLKGGGNKSYKLPLDAAFNTLQVISTYLAPTQRTTRHVSDSHTPKSSSGPGIPTDEGPLRVLKNMVEVHKDSSTVGVLSADSSVSSSDKRAREVHGIIENNMGYAYKLVSYHFDLGDFSVTLPQLSRLTRAVPSSLVPMLSWVALVVRYGIKLITTPNSRLNSILATPILGTTRTAIASMIRSASLHQVAAAAKHM